MTGEHTFTTSPEWAGAAPTQPGFPFPQGREARQFFQHFGARMGPLAALPRRGLSVSSPGAGAAAPSHHHSKRRHHRNDR
jgi:hypothetical protein